MNQTVWKYKSGDTKSIFGRPYTYNGTKWVPDEGGQKKEETKPVKDMSPVSSKPKTKLNDNTGDKTYNDMSNKITSHLTYDQQKVLMSYTDPEATGGGGGATYLSVNSFLRKGEPIGDQDKAILKGMEKAFKDVPPLHKDVTAYRGAWLDSDTISKLKAGSSFQDKAFLSTSTDEKTSKMFSDPDLMDPGDGRQPVHFTMKIPKGSKAIPVSDIQDVTYPKEKELLLDKSSKFKISKVTVVDGVTHVEMAKI